MKKEFVFAKVIVTKQTPKERIIMMSTLSQKPFHFNRTIKLANDGDALSSGTGKLIFRESDEKLGFSQTIVKHLQLDIEMHRKSG